VAAPLISLRDASVAHRDGLPSVLHEISLDVDRGDWIAIAGDNGSGKTTLLSALGGVLPLQSGSMERVPGLRSALLLQEPDDQLVASSVARELALSVPLAVDAATRDARIHAAIERFELGALLDRNPHRLSGGEKQRLALATVWLEAPDVLLLDEPLSFLDHEMRERVIAFVRELNANGVAIVWATPGGDDVALARRAIALREGRIRDAGDVGVMTAPAAGPDASPSRPGQAPAGALAQRHPRTRAVSAASVLRFESVSFRYEHNPVFADLSLDAHAGECIGVTGRNGSGKSTLLLLAGGALRPSSGRVIRHTPGHGVLYLPQSPERLFFAETVMEEIGFGLERRGVTREAARERTEQALQHAGLDPVSFAPRSPFELSFGEMRRVAFAIAFVLNPELLLLDEPMSCLDAPGCAVLDRLARACIAGGGTVMMASHERDALSHCERTLEFRDGVLASSSAGGAETGRPLAEG
jgi:energy-coupling factor transport system ATP-binding protein